MHSERETARGGEQGIKEAVEKNGHPWRVEKGKRREGTGTGCQTDFCPNRGCSWSGPPCVMTSAGISPHGGWGGVGGSSCAPLTSLLPLPPLGRQRCSLQAGTGEKSSSLPCLATRPWKCCSLLLPFNSSLRKKIIREKMN